MDSDEEAALAAIIIATFTENMKHKKRRKRRNRLNLGFKGEMNPVLSYFVSYEIFTPPNLSLCFSNFIFSEIYYTFCFENLRHVHFQFLIVSKHLF